MSSRKWNDKELAEAIKGSASWHEVANAIGISTKSESGLTRIRNHAKALGLDFSHFIIGNKSGWRKYDTDYIFRRGIEFNTSIRRYYLESVEYKCGMHGCGLSEWLGQPITLQVDHIDGDRTNNLRENLRLLCPNCHAQTETWGVPRAYRNYQGLAGQKNARTM